MDNPSKKRIEHGFKGVLHSPERSQISIHSEGQPDFEHESTQKLFSFNQSFTNIEQNNKLIQQKTHSLTRIKNLEDEIRSYKTRSNLWEKAKAEIISLNKHLKLSSLSLNCSDSAIMKEFFEVVGDVLDRQEKESLLERSQVSQAKKKEQELFQKLVEANKRKYEVEQKLVQYEHEIEKLSEVNDSLRQKSRAQSTARSSKIKEFHQETILTIHQKEMELGTLEERNEQLLKDILQLAQKNDCLKEELAEKQAELSQKIDDNEELYLEKEALKKKLQKFAEEEGQTTYELAEIKSYLNSIVEENILIRQELAKRAELITALRKIIEEARSANDEYIYKQNSITKQQELFRSQKLSQLLSDQSQLKGSLKANLKFAVNQRRGSRRIKSSLRLATCQDSLLT